MNRKCHFTCPKIFTNLGQLLQITFGWKYFSGEIGLEMLVKKKKKKLQWLEHGPKMWAHFLLLSGCAQASPTAMSTLFIYLSGDVGGC